MAVRLAGFREGVTFEDIQRSISAASTPTLQDNGGTAIPSLSALRNLSLGSFTPGVPTQPAPVDDPFAVPTPTPGAAEVPSLFGEVPHDIAEAQRISLRQSRLEGDEFDFDAHKTAEIAERAAEIEHSEGATALGQTGVGSFFDGTAGTKPIITTFDGTTGDVPVSDADAIVMLNTPNPVTGAFWNFNEQAWMVRGEDGVARNPTGDELTSISQWAANQDIALDIHNQSIIRRGTEEAAKSQDVRDKAARQDENDRLEQIRQLQVAEAERLKDLELQIAQIESDTQKAKELEQLQLEKDLSTARIAEAKAQVTEDIRKLKAETDAAIREDLAKSQHKQALEEALVIRKGEVEAAKLEATQAFEFEQNALDRAIERGELDETIRANKQMENIQRQQSALALQSFQFSILTAVAQSPEILFFAKGTPLFQMLTEGLAPDLREMVTNATPNEGSGLLNIQQVRGLAPRQQATEIFKRRALGGLSADQAIAQLRQNAPRAATGGAPRLSRLSLGALA